MGNWVNFIALGSIGLMIIGLVRPSWFIRWQDKPRRTTVFLIWVVLNAILFSLGEWLTK